MGWGDDAWGDASTNVSLATLISRVRARLLDNPVETYFTNAYSTAQTSVNVYDPSVLAQGAVIEDENTWELMLVRAANPVTSPVLVKRAHRDSPSDVVSAQDVLLVGPRFPTYLINDSIQHIVTNGLSWPYAWKAVTITRTPSTTTDYYDTATTARGLIKVTQVASTGNPATQVYNERGSGYAAKFITGLATSIVTSGNGVWIPSLYDNTSSLNITYAAELTIADITDGLMADAVVYGACSRLLAEQEFPRTDSDVTMGDATVTPGVQQRSASWFEAKFQQARRDLTSQLRTEIPVMRNA